MVPAEFVALDHPPAPAPRAASEESLTPVQAGLSHLWSRLLRRDRTGLDDDFFALGGNSLPDGEPAGTDFAQEAAFAQETGFGGSGQGYQPRSFPMGWCPAQDPQWPRDVLLTGSTGFLGAHLLSDLLAATAARVWCLVRADDAAHARQRIAEAAARYELPAPPGDRVVPLPGDLTLPRLGLSPANSASWPAAPTSSTTRARR